jgi:hypothetical protein
VPRSVALAEDRKLGEKARGLPPPPARVTGVAASGRLPIDTLLLAERVSRKSGSSGS